MRWDKQQYYYYYSNDKQFNVIRYYIIRNLINELSIIHAIDIANC